MAASSVEYNVVINGVLSGNKPGEVAKSVAPILGIHPDEALMLFNGVAHTVLQRADLSAAASFQAQLKAIGIDASTAVYQDRSAPAAAPAEQEQPAEPEPPAAAAVPETPAPAEPEIDPASLAAEFGDLGEVAPAPEPAPAAKKKPAQKPKRRVQRKTEQPAEPDIELDATLLDQASSEPDFEEYEPLDDAPEVDLGAEQEGASLDDEMDLDALFDQDDEAPAQAPAAQPEAPALSMMEEPEAAATASETITETITAVDTGVDAARSVDATPFQNATPGSNMLCPVCHSLQPRADQCPGCGADLSTPTDKGAKTRKPRLPAQLPRAAVIAAAGAGLVGVGIWLALAHFGNLGGGVAVWVAGALVGLACGFQGGRGSKAGFTCAGLAAALIAGGAFLLPKQEAVELPPPPQPAAMEVWSQDQAPQRFKQAVDDAEFFMTTDGSPRVVRQFMIERNYTMATRPEQVPESDLRYFYDVDAVDLSWIIETQPDLQTWSERMRGHLSGRQRASLGVSAPPIKPPPPVISMLQFSFMLLGVATAFGLGFLGLKRKP